MAEKDEDQFQAGSPDSLINRAPEPSVVDATWKTFEALRLVIILGAVIGTLCIIVGFVLRQFGPEFDKMFVAHTILVYAYGVTETLFMEVGSGFLVAAITIFSFDLFGRISGLISKELTLKQQIDELAKSNRVLYRARDPHAALKEELRDYYRDRAFIDRLYQPLEAAHEIVERSRSTKTDAGPYLEFIASLSNCTVGEIFPKLNRFHEKAINRKIFDKEYFVLPDPRAVMGNALKMLLSCLGEKDCYRSVSNVLFYQDNLMGVFEDAAREACNQRNVTIRRLFNVIAFEKEPPDKKTLDTIIKPIIAAHRRLAHELHGQYQFRFVSERIWDSARAQAAFDTDRHEHLRDPKNSFFGLFCMENESKPQRKGALLFTTHISSASSVSLAYCDYQNDRTKAFFDAMWEKADLRDPFAGDTFSTA